jgi:hypothetical protein
MLGRVVVELQQHVQVISDLGYRFGVLGFVVPRELAYCCLDVGCSTGPLPMLKTRPKAIATSCVPRPIRIGEPNKPGSPVGARPIEK